MGIIQFSKFTFNPYCIYLLLYPANYPTCLFDWCWPHLFEVLYDAVVRLKASVHDIYTVMYIIVSALDLYQTEIFFIVKNITIVRCESFY